MTAAEIIDYITRLPNTTVTEGYGYRFFCYSTDHTRPFVTLIESDNEQDTISDLNREGVFRLNIGISKESFKKLFSNTNRAWDYTELDQFMPHPEYAAFHFICVVAPGEKTLDQTIHFIKEAHSVAKQRFEAKGNR